MTLATLVHTDPTHLISSFGKTIRTTGGLPTDAGDRTVDHKSAEGPETGVSE